MNTSLPRWGAPLVALLTLGCAATQEDALRADLRRASSRLASSDRSPALDGSLESYVRYASERSPALRASYERWRAATLRVAGGRRMPDPVVTYAYYALPVQTRVGPQRHRLGVRQAVPWPTRLTAAADARSLAAAAAQRDFEGRALAIRGEVAAPWWRRWGIAQHLRVLTDQITMVDALAEAARGRLAVGSASVADVAQLELLAARLRDRLAALDDADAAAAARLRAALGADDAIALPIGDAPDAPGLPALDREALAAAARDNPRLAAFELRARSHEARAGVAEATRFPSFTLGVDWIETGEALTPVQGSGDDALLVSVGVSVPIFGQDAAEGEQRAAEADAAAARADRAAAEHAALAQLAEALSALRAAHRRLGLYRDTILPQAQAAYESTIGAYAVGGATVGDALAAQRALLEVASEQIDARVQHGVAWAQVEAIVGRPLEAEVGR